MDSSKEEILFLLKQRNQIQSIPFKNLIPARNIHLVYSIQESHHVLKSKNQSLERENIMIKRTSG